MLFLKCILSIMILDFTWPKCIPGQAVETHRPCSLQRPRNMLGLLAEVSYHMPVLSINLFLVSLILRMEQTVYVDNSQYKI